MGSGFSQFNDWNAEAILKGVASATSTIDSDTEVTITFTNGVPVSTTSETVSLRFENPINGNVLVAYQEVPVEVPTNTLVV